MTPTYRHTGLAPFRPRSGGGHSAYPPVIGLQQIAAALSHEHVVPVVAVEGGADADNPVVLSHYTPFGRSEARKSAAFRAEKSSN